ncbi:hypothetical protein BH20VER1_BH20VER1_17290 [soil metagenome]
MKKLMTAAIASACCLAFTSSAPAQQAPADKAIADAVVGMTRAQWAAEMKDPANIAEMSKDMAEDYTEFNGDFATRIDGKALNSRLAEGVAKDSTRRTAAEMLNEKVQVYNGNVAILTYNYAGTTIDKDGKTNPGRAKSTRVYVKQGEKWVMVHANFASDPLPK